MANLHKHMANYLPYAEQSGHGSVATKKVGVIWKGGGMGSPQILLLV